MKKDNDELRPCRKAFEEWYADAPDCPSLQRTENRGKSTLPYRLMDTQRAWHVWQACWNTRPTPTQPSEVCVRKNTKYQTQNDLCPVARTQPSSDIERKTDNLDTSEKHVKKSPDMPDEIWIHKYSQEPCWTGVNKYNCYSGKTHASQIKYIRTDLSQPKGEVENAIKNLQAIEDWGLEEGDGSFYHVNIRREIYVGIKQIYSVLKNTTEKDRVMKQMAQTIKDVQKELESIGCCVNNEHVHKVIDKNITPKLDMVSAQFAKLGGS